MKRPMIRLLSDIWMETPDGWRVTERPNTMRRRGSGKSKKQHNILYALQFGRVVTKTWLRGFSADAGLPVVWEL